MPGRNSIGDDKLLQRKIPSSARYSEVKSRVDTGHSMTRYMKKIEEMKMNSQSKNNEIFKRMKITTLAQLVLQVANLSMQEDVELSPRTLDGGETDRSVASGKESEIDDNESVASSRYSLQSVIRGVGEIDVADSNKPKRERAAAPASERDYDDCPYLLLDVRDADEFQAFHIIGARNFPVAMLSRTMNCFSKEILDFKNKTGKIIVLYDEDERIAGMAAQTMAQRGFDNIFLLSGGVKILASKIPEGMTTGKWPSTCRPPVVRNRGSSASSSVVSLAQEHEADGRKRRFTGEDLDRISHHLNNCLLPNDTGSRLSRLTNSSYRKSDAHSKLSTATNDSRRAWR